jgi:hypothetical protein
MPELKVVQAKSALGSVLEGCVENLRATYLAEEGLFPYSSRVDGARFVNDYRRPESLRYTVNTLLGLSRAARAGIADLTIDEVDEMTDTFVRLRGAEIENHADLGLLTLLLAEGTGADRDETAGAVLERLRAPLERADPSAFELQDLGWIIWGAAAGARRRVDGADRLGRQALEIVKGHFVEPRTGLPRHSMRRYRRDLVSFGGLVYFLRAMHEASATFADEEARQLFEEGVSRAIALQGPRGEWPWMIDARTGASFDVYPVFSVHQDSMAMLFLLPALDGGDRRATDAIDLSLSWVFGANELGVEFYRWNPFFAMRSIERRDDAPRLRRYLRFLSYSVTHREAQFGKARTRVNDECRSYHLGWILYVWSERLGGAVGG